MYIVATISINSYAKEKVREIIDAGARVLRFNFSHGTPTEMADHIRIAREAATESGYGDAVRVIADLPGSKMRMGKFPAKQFPVEKGREVIFKSATESNDPNEFIPVAFSDIGSLVTVGQIVLLCDGELGLEVVEILGNDSFRARALNSYHIPPLKAIHIGPGIDRLQHITPQTLEHICLLKGIQPEYVAFSFVNSADYVLRARELIRANSVAGWTPKLMAKIESPLALLNLHEIIPLVDAVMIARGDLGLTTPFEELGVNQKRIIDLCKKYGKEVVVATQVLDSVLSYFVPSRAEVVALTQSVFDGADGILLAKETGVSLTPGYSVSVAKKVIDAAQKYMQSK